MRSSRPFFFALLLASACTTEAAAPGSSTPVLTIPPTVSVDQGRVARVPLGLEGATASDVVVTPSEGLTAKVEGAELVVAASYEAGDKGTVVVEAKGARAELGVSVRAIAWKTRFQWKKDEGPIAREHATFFEDDERRVAYMLHGFGYEPYGQPLGDAFVFDMAKGTWATWAPTGDVPEPAGARRVARALGSKVHYLYGGAKKDDKDEGGLYRVDLGNPSKTFTKLTFAGTAPAGRSLHAFAFDEKSSRFVVFGGVSYEAQSMFLGDTWVGKLEGDTVTWSELKPSAAPTARYGSFTAFDPKSRRLVVWSGAQKPKGGDSVNAAQDAWALDMTKDVPEWSALDLGASPPSGRRNGCGVFEPESQRLFVYGGTKDAKASETGLFALDLSGASPTFTRIEREGAPPLRSSGFGYVDPKTHDVTCGFGNDKSLFTDVNVLGYPEK